MNELQLKMKLHQLFLRFACQHSLLSLHLITVGKLKQFKKVSSDLKTILMTDFYQLTCGFHPRRPSGRQWGREKVLTGGKIWHGEKKRKARRAPGDNVLPDQFQTVTVVLASVWWPRTATESSAHFFFFFFIISRLHVKQNENNI